MGAILALRSYLYVVEGGKMEQKMWIATEKAVDLIANFDLTGASYFNIEYYFWDRRGEIVKISVGQYDHPNARYWKKKEWSSWLRRAVHELEDHDVQPTMLAATALFYVSPRHPHGLALEDTAAQGRFDRILDGLTEYRSAQRRIGPTCLQGVDRIIHGKNCTARTVKNDLPMVIFIEDKAAAGYGW